MLTVGDEFPVFKLQGRGRAWTRARSSPTISSEAHPDKWKVVFFWPKDFTFVCPTEIAEFGRRYKEFTDRDTEVFGVSHDNEYVHLAWRAHASRPEGHPLPHAGRREAGAVGRRRRHPQAGRRAAAGDLHRRSRRTSSATSASTTCRSVAASTRCCACWTGSRPTSCAPATGSPARRRWRRPDHDRARAASARRCPRRPRTSS